jgi:hypothetical protein
MSLASQASDAQVYSFIAKVTQAAILAAVAITSEATGTANHTNRVALAKLVLNSPEPYGRVMAEGLASQALNDASTDTAINNSVSALWNGYAGVV